VGRFSRLGTILSEELNAVRRRDPDLDAGEVTAFTLPLLGRATVIALIGVVPLVVIRMGDNADDLFVPLVASFALAAVCSAVITWVVAIVISALVTVVLYRKPPRPASRLVVHTINDSFGRINDATSNLMLLALVAGLIALAIGLPARTNADAEHSVIDDLLAAQVAILLAALAIAFIAEACRSAADIVDDQSLALAWPWALLIVSSAWVLATVAGPLEFTTMVRRLLSEWLPATVGDLSQAEAIDEVIPAGSRWIASFGALPIVALIWYLQASRNDGFAALREPTSGDLTTREPRTSTRRIP
jgi:hypothetical protein